MDVCGANHLDPAMRHHSRATHAEALSDIVIVGGGSAGAVLAARLS
jgi:ribulose 1,5-bisphosphate synthetase/thiazole synthase